MHDALAGTLTNFENTLGKQELDLNVKSAAMGIRTPVASVRGSHDWPDYTIAATVH